MFARTTKAKAGLQAKAGAPERKPEAAGRNRMMETHAEALEMQRTIGNRATSLLLSGAGFQRPGSGVSVQRKCASCAAGKGKCSECEEKEKKVQRKAGGSGASASASPVASAVQQGMQSPGQTLEPHTRDFMESGFGRDFSDVRVHNNAQAAESAGKLDSLAYTVGNDIVFGPGRYAPHTGEGQRLVAHELTHTVQQDGAGHVAFDKIGVSQSGDAAEQEADAAANAVVSGGLITAQPNGATRVARQPKTPAAAQPPAPAAPAGPTWAACDPKEIPNLTGEVSEAGAWVQKAIDDLGSKEGIPAHTNNALSRYLATDATAIKATIIPHLRAILADLTMGATHFQCQTEQQCRAQFPGGANAYSGNPITLCPGYFDKAQIERITTLIHESGHNAGLSGNVIEWQWPFPGLSEKDRLGNTESYAAFVRSNRYSSIAPYEQGAGVQLGGGLLSRGSRPAQWVVRAELDVVLHRRVLRFVDLHGGLQFSYDGTGYLTESVSIGPRLFAPLSLTGKSLYLDLRAGAAVGFPLKGPPTQDITLGPTAEGRIGLQGGNLGVSVSYLHIWDLMNKNPEVSEVTINGEIRF